MEYSLPYIAIITLFGLCAFFYECTSNEERKQQLTMVAVVSFYLFFAFRGYVYSDWTSYSYLLNEIEWKDIWGLKNFIEPGFMLLCCLCASITREYAFLVFVITTIDVFLILRFLKHAEIKNVALVFMLIIVFDGIEIMFNLLRNQIAIFIFLNALEYIEKRKPLPYFLICALSACFHVSAVTYIPMYFLLNIRINKWVFTMVFLFFFVFFLSKISIIASVVKVINLDGALADKVIYYTEQLTSRREIGIIPTLFQFFMIGLINIYYDRITLEFKHGVHVVNALLAYFLFFFVFAEVKTFSIRMSMLFVFSIWIAWVYLFKAMSIEGNKILMGIFLFSFCMYYAFYTFTQPIQEYDNLLFGSKSQVERLKIFNKYFEPDD